MPVSTLFRSSFALAGACVLVHGALACGGARPAPAPIPPPSSPPPLLLPLDRASVLDVDNAPASFPDSVVVAAFADGFQRSGFLPSRRARGVGALRLNQVLRRVLDTWPVPLRGYAYTTQVVESDLPVLFPYGAGRLDATSALLSELGLIDSELAALLALAVARTELAHPVRYLAAAPDGFRSAAARADARFSAANLIAGLDEFSFAVPSERELVEADALASFWLASQPAAAGTGPGVLAAAFGKLAAFHRRAGDSLRDQPAHPLSVIAPARIRRVLRTTSIVLHDSAARLGLGRRGEVRAGFQPLFIARYGPLVDIVGVFTLGPAERPARLGHLNLRIVGRRAIFSESSADFLYPGTSVPVVYSGRLPEHLSLDLIAAADYGPVLDRVAEWRVSDATLFDRRGGSTAASPRPR